MFENDIRITGKHAMYMKYLSNKAKIYERYIDVYMNGAIIGFLYGRRSEKDNDIDDNANILASTLANERLKCDFIYRLIMLLDETTGHSVDERINRAFKDVSIGREDESVGSNMKLFDSYVLGGIEVLYDIYANGCETVEDRTKKVYKVVKNFNDELEASSLNEKIKEAMVDYS